jgi:LacI family transcriptional regulator
MDDTLAAEELTNLLISLGHRHIAFIEGDQAASDRRRAGYERALKAHRIAVDPALVVPGTFEFESGVAAAHKLFALPEPPTAIFAANDDMALGALTAAQRLGIAVPHDVAIAGFDDSQTATLVWPELTTVRQPLKEMAMAAVEMLLSDAARIEPGQPAPVRVLPHEVIVRGSTAAPAKGRA